MQTQLNIRIDEELKSNAEAILSRLGISLSDAVRMFLSQVILDKGFPYTPKVEEKKQVKDVKAMINQSISQNLVALKLLAER